jgi:hypothetical protein
VASPTNDVRLTFVDFCNIFEAAKAAGNYNAVLPYLYSHATMHEINDPSAVVETPQPIV